MKVFLGGTCNESTWRDTLIPMLQVDYFNPVVDDWTPECQAEEIRQRKECDVCVYTITPHMEGFYSIAEVVDDSHRRPGSTVFCVLRNDEYRAFSVSQAHSLAAVQKLLERNGVVCVDGIDQLSKTLNSWAS